MGLGFFGGSVFFIHDGFLRYFRGGGTVIITNNTNKEYSGRVWTDSEELYNGRIRAWNSKTFFVSKDDSVYTDFESNGGGKSSPSGYVSRGGTLILDL